MSSTTSTSWSLRSDDSFRKKKQQKRASSLKLYLDHDTNDKVTALHSFCRSGSHLDDIEALVESCPELVSYQTPTGGETPLHYAVAAHDSRSVQLLLRADPKAASIRSTSNGRYGSKTTPLHVALLTDAPFEIIKLLVNGAKGCSKTRDGQVRTPLKLATEVYGGSRRELVIETIRTNK